MKIKTQELIRSYELSSRIAIIITATLLTKCNNYEVIKNLEQLLNENQIDIYKIGHILSHLFTLDILTSFKRETLTKDYKVLKNLYDEIIKNTCIFYNDLGATDTISIFATYVYMYRNGYFSHNKQILYSSNLKDFSNMNGLDIIRGHGVCRSISSMLKDIYNEMGMKSLNLDVKADLQTLKNIESLSTIDLESTEQSHKYVKIIEIITKYIPLFNHLITMVEKDGINYILDPTNDAFLYYSKNKLNLANNPNFSMQNYSFKVISLLHNFVEQNNNYKLRQLKEQINLPTISYTEYKRKYLESLKICLENKDLFEEFYQRNKPLIEEINTLSENQNCLVKRLIPILPIKNKK